MICEKNSPKPIDKSVITVYTVDIQLTEPLQRSDEVNVIIDNRSGKPIYDQIVSQIRDQIISGALKEDEPLPSIRNLAKDLRISVITTKRAYEELEREGFIYTVAAKGSFVAPKNTELIREAHLVAIEEKLGEVLKLASPAGISKDEIITILDSLTEDEK